jgi:hypothetical protein
MTMKILLTLFGPISKMNRGQSDGEEPRPEMQVPKSPPKPNESSATTSGDLFKDDSKTVFFADLVREDSALEAHVASCVGNEGAQEPKDSAKPAPEEWDAREPLEEELLPGATDWPFGDRGEG